MAFTSMDEWSEIAAASNTEMNGIALANTMTPTQIDDVFREMMKQLKSGTHGVYASAGLLYGLTLSNNGSDAVNDIDIAAGIALDSTNVGYMKLASALTKRIDAAWAVGTNQGGLDGTESSAGTPDTSTWYHVWLIKRVDTGVVDVLFSESATAPTMPTNYTLKRRIGAVFNNSSGDIRAFTQSGDLFLLTTPLLDINISTLGTTAALQSLSVPTGLKVQAVISGHQAHSAGHNLMLSSPEQADIAPGTPGIGTSSGVANGFAPFNLTILTDTSGRIRARSSVNPADSFRITTFGWIDTRGRLA